MDGLEERIRRAFATVPRQEFLPNEEKPFAHVDEPLPIGFGQTTSQPSMIYEMLLQLRPEKGMKVLEVGSGSGYVLALLEEITGEKVYGVERIKELVERANRTLERLGYRSRSYHRNGWYGLEEFSPYDRILVSASLDQFPEILFSQLKEGGTMVYPESRNDHDVLKIVEKKNGKAVEREGIECRFVKFVK